MAQVKPYRRHLVDMSSAVANMQTSKGGQPRPTLIPWTLHSVSDTLIAVRVVSSQDDRDRPFLIFEIGTASPMFGIA
jgi:hypothetical protein